MSDPLPCKSSLRPARGRDLYDSRHISDIWKQTLFGAGDSWEREGSEAVPAPQNEEVKPPPQEREYCEDDPTTYWDYDPDEYIRLEKEKAEKEKQEMQSQEKQEWNQAASPERPSTLRVEPPAAPPAFADVPAAGLPSGANTPSYGASGGPRRDSQLTDKGYFDVKFYHNRLCCSAGLSRPPGVSNVGRFAATKPASDIASVIHGDNDSTNNDNTYTGWENDWDDDEEVPAPPRQEVIPPVQEPEFREDDPTTYWDYVPDEAKKVEPPVQVPEFREDDPTTYWDYVPEEAQKVEPTVQVPEFREDDPTTYWDYVPDEAQKVEPPVQVPEFREDDPTTYWDYVPEKEEKEAQDQQGAKPASPGRPSTLRVEPPAAPPAFADVLAAGLPSGANIPSGGTSQDSQKTRKGYRDAKYSHNRLW